MPVIGRFLSADPLWSAFPSSSPYMYANDNPMSFKDPSGLAPEGELKGHGGKKSGNKVLSLFEQIMHDALQNVANESSSGGHYQEATSGGPAPRIGVDPSSESTIQAAE